VIGLDVIDMKISLLPQIFCWIFCLQRTVSPNLFYSLHVGTIWNIPSKDEGCW